MRSVICSLAAALLATLLAAGTMAQSADDEWVGLVLETRRNLDEAIAQVDQEIAVIPERIASDDWRVFPTTSGGVVELDLETLEDYVPMAQVVAGHPEIKQLLLDGLKQSDELTWIAVTAVDAMAGGIENMPPADVVALVKQFYTQSAGHKGDAYAAHLTKLKAEREDLAKLRAEMQAELDRLAAAASAPPSPNPSVQPSPAPTPEPSPDPTIAPRPAPSPDPTIAPSANPSAMPSPEPTPDVTPEPSPQPSESGHEIEYDALIGLTACDEDDPACDEDDQALTDSTPQPTLEPTIVPTPEPTIAPTTRPTPEATLGLAPEPSPSPEATLAPTAQPTPEATLEPTIAPTLEPTIAPTLAPTGVPCPEGDMWCDDTVPEVTPEPTVAPSPDPLEPLGESAIDKLMGCWGNEQACYAPLPAEINDDGLWDAGLLAGEWEQGGRPLRLVQDGTQISGTYEGQKGPIVIEAEEVSRNRIEGYFYGDFFWFVHLNEDEEYTGSLGNPEDGDISCSESRNGTALWGQIEMELDRWEGDGQPAAHLVGYVAPCDEAWREDNGRYAHYQTFSPDRLVPPPEGTAWADVPADPDRPWTGDWQIDLGSMRLDQDGDDIDGVILSPGGLVTFAADPAVPAVHGEWADPETHMVGQWQGDAFGAWLASYGAVPATWQCAETRDGAAQWGEILLRVGGMDGEAPSRIDAAWMPCDEDWREANYDDDWWYDGEDTFRGWRLADRNERD